MHDSTEFLKYYLRIKARTRALFPLIPPEKIEWSYRADKFTVGDLIRHLALIERWMYGETIQLRPSRYQGCGPEFAAGYEAIIQLYEDMSVEMVNILEQLTEEDLQRKCPTPGGIELRTWKWLRAMLEHEIHHRGQLYTYLGLLGITPPPIFGLTSEAVIKKSEP
ncbi:MAG: DinB family protein [Phaeodactylibacter sp.]|nr:DinB family protein [Phaeodactylibacter sp.]